MCRMKSAIILKDRIFIPDYDSHSEMLEHLGIEDNYLGASKKFVRAELYPKDSDVFSDIECWTFAVDQDITPEWFSEKKYRPKMVDAVKKWAKDRIHIGVTGLKIKCGENHYIKDCKDVVICGSAEVAIVRGSSTIECIRDNSTAGYICDSTTVMEICDRAAVRCIRDSAKVGSIHGRSAVRCICDSSTVGSIRGISTVEYICDSVTVEYICDSVTVELISDRVTVECIYGSSTVMDIRDSVTVKNIADRATVKSVRDDATVKHVCDRATLISDSNKKWNNSRDLVICDHATFKDKYGKVIYQSGGYQLVSVESGQKIGDAK